MIAPAAMDIEAAKANLENALYLQMHHEMLELQKKEYFSATPYATQQDYEAYALGVEVCRVLLYGMPNAIKGHVSL